MNDQARVKAHREFLIRTEQLEARRQERRGVELLEVLREELGARLSDLIDREPRLSSVVDQVKRGSLEPYSTALDLLKRAPSPADWLRHPADGLC